MIIERDSFQISKLFDWWAPLSDTINTPACDPWGMSALKLTVAVYIAALVILLAVLLVRIIFQAFRKTDTGFDRQVEG